mmetsp:Transcript_20956/g.25783  ORF Transcript_20956/g.25783 Transcript_20956/m.25783 type:complete len:360 (-) Transcript_20956:265-1344(-)
MFISNKALVLALVALPSALACVDSSTYTFGHYEFNGATTIRDCAWITVNFNKIETRQDEWCGVEVGGSLVSDECPVACDACPVTAAPSVPPPTASPTVSAAPTAAPTRPPSPAPSPFPTARPSSVPSESPSDVPSTVPSDMPSDIPSFMPSDLPSKNPSDMPSDMPSFMPSDMPSMTPSDSPSLTPSKVPSDAPSGAPSVTPSLIPSKVPSDVPTGDPTFSIKPSPAPSAAPSGPTVGPTKPPTKAPTKAPVATPATCEDSVIRFKVDYNGDGQYKPQSCIWVARKETATRCAVDGVSEICADTCEACATCADSTLRLKIPKDGKKIARYCTWVARKFTNKRCGYEGVAEACRSTCGTC